MSPSSISSSETGNPAPPQAAPDTSRGESPGAVIGSSIDTRDEAGMDPSDTPFSRALSFMGRAMRFMAPVAVLFLLLDLPLWKNGDAWPVFHAMRVQQETPGEALYGRGWFSQQFNVYKLAGIRHRKPKILVIGSSRVMQFRDFMFPNLEEGFYNGGGLIQNASDLAAFADLLAAGEIPAPEGLIVGIDPWWIKTIADTSTWLPGADEATSFGGHVLALRRIIDDGFTGEGFLADWTARDRSPFFNYPAIGRMARLHGGGFRKDGSRQYDPRMLIDFAENPRYEDRESPPVLLRVRRLNRQFAPPVRPDPGRAEGIVAVLSAIRGRGIAVHALLPPFSDETLSAIRETPALSEWWRYYAETFPRMLSESGIPVVSISSPSDIGLSDLYMIDGFHPGEVFAAHIAGAMAENGPPAGPLGRVDAAELSRRIAGAQLQLAFRVPPAATGR